MELPNFDWSELGDIEEGRPTLGAETKVVVYRLMQYTMRAILVQEFGDDRARALLVRAGQLAGREFCKNLLDTTLALNDFLAQIKALLLDLSIGILRMEKSDLEEMRFVVTVSEDLDCSGLSIGGSTVCDYDEGFLQGILDVYTGQKFEVHEIDCWSTGERTCRFTIDRKP